MKHTHAILLLLTACCLSAAAVSSYARGEEEPAADMLDISLSLDYEYSCPELKSVMDSSCNFIADSQAVLAPVAAKLARIRQGSFETLSILHIGDSHIQAGFLTGAIRDNFQRDFGNSGRGLVAPLRIIRTNEPTGYGITSPNTWIGTTCLRNKDNDGKLGLCGMGITSPESGVELTLSADTPFHIVRVFHHVRAPWIDVPDSLSIGITCAGSDPSGVTTLFLDDTMSRVTLRAEVGDSVYNYQTYYGFSLETGDPGVLYHSAGINGAAFAHYNNNPCMAEGQRLLEPDLIIISLGTNDSYGNNYVEEEVAQQITAFLDNYSRVFPDTPLMLTTPMEACRRRTVKRRRTYMPNENVATTGDIIKRIAAERGMACWDLYAAAGGQGANKVWYDNGMMSADRLHPTRKGYAFQGEMFYDAFTRYYNSQITTQDGEF